MWPVAFTFSKTGQPKLRIDQLLTMTTVTMLYGVIRLTQVILHFVFDESKSVY